MLKFDDEGWFEVFFAFCGVWQPRRARFTSPRRVAVTLSNHDLGKVKSLPSRQFWCRYITEPGFGLCDQALPEEVKRANPQGVWVASKDAFPFRSGRYPAAWATRKDAHDHWRQLLLQAKNGPRPVHDLNLVRALGVAPIPPSERREVGHVVRYVETFVETRDHTHHLLGDNFGDRSESGAANIDNYVANRWQIAWEVVHGIRRLPVPSDLAGEKV